MGASSTSEPRVRVHRILDHSVAEGPGARSVLWVQGCSIRCDGCFNPGTWTARGGRLMSSEDVVAALVARSDIEGVTFLGGEPFEQAPALAAVAQRVRARGLSVMTFSGFTYETLLADDRPGHAALLAATDLLVDGPYEADKPDTARPWVGSTNQRFRCLTDRYTSLIAQLEQIPDRLEIRLRPEGTVEVNGLASVEQIEALLGDLGRRRRLTT